MCYLYWKPELIKLLTEFIQGKPITLLPHERVNPGIHNLYNIGIIYILLRHAVDGFLLILSHHRHRLDMT